MQVGDKVRYFEDYCDEEGFFVAEGEILAINGNEVTLTDAEEGECALELDWLRAHQTDAELGHHGL